MSTTAYIISAVLVTLAVVAEFGHVFAMEGFPDSDRGQLGSVGKFDNDNFQKWRNLYEKRQMMGYDDGFGDWDPARNKFVNWRAMLGNGAVKKRQFNYLPVSLDESGDTSHAGLQNWRSSFLKRTVKRSADAKTKS